MKRRTSPTTFGLTHQRPPLQAVSASPSLMMTSTSSGMPALLDFREAEELDLDRQAGQAFQQVGAGDLDDIGAFDEELLRGAEAVDPGLPVAPAVEHGHLDGRL